MWGQDSFVSRVTGLCVGRSIVYSWHAQEDFLFLFLKPCCLPGFGLCQPYAERFPFLCPPSCPQKMLPFFFGMSFVKYALPILSLAFCDPSTHFPHTCQSFLLPSFTIRCRRPSQFPSVDHFSNWILILYFSNLANSNSDRIFPISNIIQTEPGTPPVQCRQIPPSLKR